MADKMEKKDLHNILKDEFSCHTVGGCRVPYIVRTVNGKPLKYVATRMAEYEVLKKYIINIYSYTYTSCTPVIAAYAITHTEAMLLNRINEEHYGNGIESRFLAEIDYIVRLEDLHNFYIFIDICYKKLECNNTSGYEDKCGFICIDSNLDCCVPYYAQNGKKYLPLLFFEGNTESLIQRGMKLENWDLAYLKFCWQIQGLKAKFFAIDSCLVVSFDDIKNLYPPETLFEDFWPAKITKSYFTADRKSFQTDTPGSWFKLVPDKYPILHISTEPVPIVPHSTEVKKNQMVQQQKHQQEQQIITTPQIQKAQENNSNNAPYKIVVALLGGQFIHCINAKPYIYSDWMMTLKDLAWKVLPACDVQEIGSALIMNFKTTISFGKPEQLAVLKENGLIQSMYPGGNPMVMLKDVILVLPQLRTFVLMQDE